MLWYDESSLTFDCSVGASGAAGASSGYIGGALFAAKVFEAILAKRSDSNPPTVASSDTKDSTDRAKSPITDGTSAMLASIAWSKSPSTLVRSFTSWLPPRYQIDRIAVAFAFAFDSVGTNTAAAAAAVAGAEDVRASCAMAGFATKELLVFVLVLVLVLVLVAVVAIRWERVDFLVLLARGATFRPWRPWTADVDPLPEVLGFRVVLGTLMPLMPFTALGDSCERELFIIMISK
jgi:hypothetical protein